MSSSSSSHSVRFILFGLPRSTDSGPGGQLNGAGFWFLGFGQGLVAMLVCLQWLLVGCRSKSTLCRRSGSWGILEQSLKHDHRSSWCVGAFLPTGGVAR